MKKLSEFSICFFTAGMRVELVSYLVLRILELVEGGDNKRIIQPNSFLFISQKKDCILTGSVKCNSSIG